MKKILKIIFVFALVLLTKGIVFANTGTIDAVDYVAEFRNTNYGHINFKTTEGVQVQITDSLVTGEIWGDVVGWVTLNPTEGGVLNDGDGNLSGYAWGQNTGWINFAPAEGGVSINSSGEFVGDAWSENFGWIHFLCPGTGTTCVKTDWEKDNSCQGGCGGADMCENIAGDQGSVPTGYYQDGDDNCFPIITTPPVDLCPNITGVQNTIPLNTHLAPNGDCVPDEVDDNCPLNQHLENGVCVPDLTFCQINPNHPSCIVVQTCEENPNQITCQYENCLTNPSLPGCQEVLETCLTNPTLCEPPPPPPPPNTCYIIAGVPPTLWQTINCMIQETIEFTEEVLTELIDQIKYVFNNPAGNILTKTIAITGLAFGTIFTLLPYLFSTPFSFSELVLMPYRLWSLIMSILGLRKRVRPWGTVYDSVTKQPLDPVVVDLFDAEGNKVQTSITDMDGRYGFLTAPGHYWMRPRKTHYSFPSFKLAGKTRDEIYLDLYFGNFFEVKNGEEVITKNIPMDREHFDWNEFAKKDQKLMRFYSKRDIWLNRIADSLFSFGFFISFVALLSSQSIYNIIIFSLYIIMLIVRETGIKQKMFGRILSKDGTPYSYAIMKVFSKIGNVEVARKVANQYGKYYCLIQNGHYTVTFEKKNVDGSYTQIYVDDMVEVKRGVINKYFRI